MKFSTELEIADSITAGVVIEYVYQRGTMPTQDDPGEPETADIRAVRWNWIRLRFPAGDIAIFRETIDRETRKAIDSRIVASAEQDIIEACLADYIGKKEINT